MAKEIKYLYESFVNKVIEDKIVEKREEGGATIEVTKTIKKLQPVKIAIRKPTRQIYEEAEIFYAKQIAKYIKDGLLPYSLVAKRYANDGGFLNDEEKLRLDALEKEETKLKSEFFALVGENSEEKNALLIKINDIITEINKIKNAYANIYENTAETKADNKTVEWWILNLSYIDDNGYKPIFGEGDDVAKLAAYDEIYEKEDPFINECIKKLNYLIQFWLASKGNTTKIDFASIDKLYSETLTDYKPVEEEVPSVKLEEKLAEKTDTVVVPMEMELVKTSS